VFDGRSSKAVHSRLISILVVGSFAFAEVRLCPVAFIQFVLHVLMSR
jgi:hypothetical protein